MTRVLTAAALLLSLAACGIDGEPQPPAATKSKATGVTVTGDAYLGVETKL